MPKAGIDKILFNRKLSSSLRLVLDYFLGHGAEIKRTVYSGNSHDLFIAISYKKTDIYIRSNNRRFSHNLNSALGASVTGNKYATTRFFRLHKIQTPKTIQLEETTRSKDILARFSKTVVKPVNGAHGNGVTVGVNNIAGLQKAIRHARKFSENVIIQEYVEGEDYRLLFINYELVSAIKRSKASVVGDGRSTIEELINRENKKRATADGKLRLASWQQKAISKIPLEEVQRQQGKSFLTKIPYHSQKIDLLKQANITLGGYSEDVTKQVNPQLIRQYAALLHDLGLALCGIDVISKDISKPPTNKKTYAIELNAQPGLMPHANPAVGAKKDIGRCVALTLYKRQKSLQKTSKNVKI